MRLGWAGVLALLVSACTGLDLSGREYPCIPDAGPNGDYYFYAPSDPQCPSGWRCGLEGFCHQRDAGAAYKCTSDLNCEASWRCSSDGVCVDASKDGLVGSPDASFTARRLNPLWLSDRPEHFAQSEYYTPGVDAFFNPIAIPWRSFSLVADGGLFHGLATQSDAGLWGVASVEADRLRLLPYVALAEGPYTAYAFASDGTTDVFQLGSSGSTIAWPGFTPTGVRIEAGSDQVLYGYYQAPNGPPAPGLMLAFAGTQYAIADGQTFDCDLFGQSVFTPVPQGLAPLDIGGPGCIPAPDGGCEAILDMAVLEADAYSQNLYVGPYDGFGDTSLVAATADGLFIALRSFQCPSAGEFENSDGTPGSPTPNWQGLDTPDIPNFACPQMVQPSSPSYQVRRLHGLSEQEPNPWMLAEEVPVGTDPSDQSNVSIALLSFGTPGNFEPAAPNAGVNCASSIPVNDYITCAACPSQAKFLGAQLSVNYPQASDVFANIFQPPPPPDSGVVPLPIAEVRCGLTASDGTPVVDVFQFDFGPLYVTGNTTCSATFVSESAAGDAIDLAHEDTATSGNPSFAGDYGQVWLEGGLLTDALAVTLSQPPTAVFGSGGALTLSFGDGGIWLPDPVVGFQLSANGSTAILGSVKNRPEWVVQSDGLITDTAHSGSHGPAVVATLDPTADPFRLPLQAVLLTLPDGSSQLVISSFDVLLGADMTSVVATLAGADAGSLGGVEIIPAPLDARAVPFPKSPIISLTATGSGTADGGLFGGYALTANGLASYSAVTQQHWDSELVNVPQGDWIAVVDDDGRARIGYADGRVYSLPSRVLLVNGFTDSTIVSDYAALCGETVALSSSGIYALVPTAGGGQWAPVDLSSAAVRGSSLAGLSGGKLYSPGPELDVFGRVGTVTQITCQ